VSDRDEDLLKRVVDAVRAEAAEEPSPPKLGADAHDRIAAAILALPTSALPASPVTAPRRPARVRTLYYALPLAAAAALVLFVARPSGPGGSPLPAYDVAVRAASETRGAPSVPAEPAAVTKVHPTSTLDLVVRPHESLAGTVAVRAVLVKEGVATAWNPPIELADGGAARIHGRVDALLPGRAGECEIVIAIARARSLPTGSELAAIATGGSRADDAVRILRARIEILPP
jgi:hypothetical protein